MQEARHARRRSSKRKGARGHGRERIQHQVEVIQEKAMTKATAKRNICFVVGFLSSSSLPMSSYFSVPHSHSHARIHKIWIVLLKSSSSIAVFRSPPSLPPSPLLLTGDTPFPTSSSLPPSSFPPSFPLRSPSALVPDNVVDEYEDKDDKGHEPEHVPAGGGGKHLVQPPHGRAHQPVRPRKPIALRVDMIEEKGVE